MYSLSHFSPFYRVASQPSFLRLLMNSFWVSLHVYRYGIEGAFTLCLVAIGVWFFFVGLWPRSAVASLLFGRRNANLAGDLRVVLVFWVPGLVFPVSFCFIATLFHCTDWTTAFNSIRSSLFIRITGPSLRASSAELGKKNATAPTGPQQWSRKEPTAHSKQALLHTPVQVTYEGS